MLNVGLEQQQQIRGADGSILWSGAQVIANSYIIINTGLGTGTAAIKMADAVQYDPRGVSGDAATAGTDTLNVIPRPETTAAGASPTADLPMSLTLFGRISPASINATNLIGVAQEPIGIGKRGLIAAGGSICCVACTATAIAVGAFVGSSATAGAVALQAVGGTNAVLGAVLKTNLVSKVDPSFGTGSTTLVGILIKGGSASIT